jgi:hypothetical protein
VGPRLPARTPLLAAFKDHAAPCSMHQRALPGATAGSSWRASTGGIRGKAAGLGQDGEHSTSHRSDLCLTRLLLS